MSVPSFSSFPLPAPSSSAKEANSSTNGSKESRKHKKEKRDDRKESSRDKERKHRHHSRDPTRASRRDEDDAKPIDYIVDKRGDQGNLDYGAPAESTVPKYKNGNHILGLPTLTILGRRYGLVEVGERGRPKRPTLTDDKAKHTLQKAPSKRILIITNPLSHDAEFIPLQRRIPKDAPGDNIWDKRDASESEEEGTMEEEESDTENIVLTVEQRAIQDAERAVDADPSNPKNWLKRLSVSLAEVTQAKPKQQAAITLAILKKALEADERHWGCLPLVLQYLQAGALVWKEDKLEDEWEEAYAQENALQIWMEWLNWRIRTTGCEEIVDDVVRVLNKVSMDEMGQLRVFWRVACAFREAGFVERAMAMFQAQAELTFELPQDIHGMQFEAVLDHFEEFWESETPRMGEPGSTGWAQWVAARKPDPTPNSASPATPPIHGDAYQRWAMQERYADVHQVVPAKAFEQTNDDWDAFSVIPFADLKPFMLKLKTSQGRDAFRLCWLSFLGLTIPGFSEGVLEAGKTDAGWDDRWSANSFFAQERLDPLFPSANEKAPLYDTVSGASVGRERQYAAGPIPAKAWGYGVLDPLDDSMSAEGMWGKLDLVDVDVGLVRRLFAQMRFGNEDAEWDVLSLAFEALVDIKGALKISQGYLSNARDSLPHWAAHARLQRRRGKLNDARKVYANVLGSLAPSVHSNQPWLARLWWDAAEMEWLAGKPDAAQTLILRAVGVQDTSKVAVLRAKRTLEDNAWDLAREARWKDREAWWKLRALLELILTGSATSAIDVMDQVPLDGIPEESRDTAVLLMLYRHSVVLKNVMEPRLLRERSRRALEKWPGNSIVLEAFLEGEKGQSVWGRVRAIATESPGMVTKGVRRRIQEVWTGKWQAGQWASEAERVRARLAVAVRDERTARCPEIWRVYIELERKAGDLQKAKTLFWVAIAECPNAKVLYLLAFDALRQVFTPDELENLIAMMTDKGLRLRTVPDPAEPAPLAVNNRETDITMDEVDTFLEGVRDEVEEEAAERRRLMPFL
ncbi:hypothetical protein CYLTODRAFT_346760 [Cylindrobasidium torrendii FP15055 ss-10]|uniref:DUF1740-domain-containing protein n=1 Tax=Cylindrobasidium torrendii FP15055 ss-10 TaxID=1314674 RepID=A0A0D7BLD6_9AGAR|nr:hypothetical protein CYLTODRAFT_346760 [Cylindrobasidium torrendii FP15055 ss-10]